MWFLHIFRKIFDLSGDSHHECGKKYGNIYILNYLINYFFFSFFNRTTFSTSCLSTKISRYFDVSQYNGTGVSCEQIRLIISGEQDCRFSDRFKANAEKIDFQDSFSLPLMSGTFVIDGRFSLVLLLLNLTRKTLDKLHFRLSLAVLF